MSRSAIVRHHRDAGIALGPLLFISRLTGAILTLRPFAYVVLSPWSSATEMRDATAAPKLSGGPLSPSVNWGAVLGQARRRFPRSEEHTSELQSLMRISYAVFCLKKKTITDILIQDSNNCYRT